MGEPRIALCHEWTTTYGGSDQVASRLAQVLEIRDVFTFAADPRLARQLFPGRKVRAHRLGMGATGRHHWQWLLPLMPGAWSRADLRDYDVVITSSHACTNSIRVRPGAAHISYCHTPMRYAWEWRSEIGRIPRPLRPAWPAVAAALRSADRRWASRVTVFVANSHHVARRIHACYGKEARVVYPPVDTDFFCPDTGVRRDGFFLVAGRLVAYKRADLAVKAASMAGVPLVVAGRGPELSRLRRVASEEASFITDPSPELLRDLYRRSAALLNPGVEDFGMTMAEAQACGTPVIALGRGGAKEIVADGRSGLLYDDPSAEGLAAVIRRFDRRAFSRKDVRSVAEAFSVDRFEAGIRRVLADVAGGDFH